MVFIVDVLFAIAETPKCANVDMFDALLLAPVLCAKSPSSAQFPSCVNQLYTLFGAECGMTEIFV